MEHESFENEAIANTMNQNFISIKVDREERPDLDAIYMNFVQMTTGSGGWPLTVFLTPDLAPFFGGTYFPPEDYHERPGFKRVLESISNSYQNRRAEIDKNRDEIIQRLQVAGRWKASQGQLSEELLSQAHNELSRQFDTRYGGFGSAPKFPGAMALSFLLRYYKRTGSQSALDMVVLSLDEMARGGIYDQLGGGFHRYSVDERWLVPHFEKMLYDNALLTRVYLEAHQVTGSPYYREIVLETLGYIQREMMDASGGFYSSQDADSEGYEGKFYVWVTQEVESILGKEDAKIFVDYFDVTAYGNFEGNNILNHRRELEAFSASLKRPPSELKQCLDRCRAKLFKERENRVRPETDGKVLAAWNGMMLTAFAEAAFAFKDPQLLKTALSNASFLAKRMIVNERVLRSWSEGTSRFNGYLEDYALVIQGWLATYHASGDTQWLLQAEKLIQTQLELFWDEEQSSFYFTSSDHEQLIIRHQEFMDNATPSGNSVSCLNLLYLGVLLGKSEYRDRAEQMLGRMTKALGQYPSAFSYWLQALDFLLGPTLEIAIVGQPSAREQLLQPVREGFFPNKVLAVKDPLESELDRKIPLLKGKTAVDNRATAYFCRNYACQQPVTTLQEVEKVLSSELL